ncbi:hypothetical protein MBGDF03_01151 [Thermoplasmatales archaeon SCGC AB-540-F20]|nr:hypothetical protein MBGDF03_01151 [Thermoplasmatales archaeon SCGC AB-540-F20]
MVLVWKSNSLFCHKVTINVYISSIDNNTNWRGYEGNQNRIFLFHVYSTTEVLRGGLGEERRKGWKIICLKIIF